MPIEIYDPFHPDWKPKPDPSTPVTDIFLERLEAYLTSMSTAAKESVEDIEAKLAGIPGGSLATSRPRYTVMAIGDSLTDPVVKFDATTGYCKFQGWGPNDWLTGANIISGSRLDVLGGSATGGYTAQQIHDVHLPVVLAARPTWCVLMSGANDIGAGMAGIPAALATNTLMVQKMLAVGTTPILATLPPLSGNFPAIDAINGWAADTANQLGLPLVDFNSALSAMNGGYRLGLTGDTVHPNADGAAVMAAVLARVISQLGSPPARAFMVSHDGGPSYANLSSGGTMPDGWWATSDEADRVLAPSTTYAGNKWTLTRGSDDTLVFGPGVNVSPGQHWDFTCRLETIPGDGGWAIGVREPDAGLFAALMSGNRFAVPEGGLVHWHGIVPAGFAKMHAFFLVGTAPGAQIKIGQASIRST